jgi:hypothetical protein
MAEVQGLERVLFRLNSIANKYGPSKKLVLGYRAPHATVVHERLGVYHAPPTRAKYLEEPARRLIPEVARTVTDVISRGGTVEDALLAGGNLVMDESQKIVPVNTGELKASKFVEVERV